LGWDTGIFVRMKKKKKKVNCDLTPGRFILFKHIQSDVRFVNGKSITTGNYVPKLRKWVIFFS